MDERKLAGDDDDDDNDDDDDDDDDGVSLESDWRISSYKSRAILWIDIS